METEFLELVNYLKTQYQKQYWVSCDLVLSDILEFLEEEDKSILDHDAQVIFNRILIKYYSRFYAIASFDMELVQEALSELERLNAADVTDYESVCSLYNSCPEELYKKAISIHPNSLPILYAYALHAKNKAELDIAIGCLRYLLSIYPEANYLRPVLHECEQEALTQLLDKLTTDALTASEVDKLVCLSLITKHKPTISRLLTSFSEVLSEAQQQDLEISNYFLQQEINAEEVVQFWEQRWMHQPLSLVTGIYLTEYFHQQGKIQFMLPILENTILASVDFLRAEALQSTAIDDYFINFNEEDQELIATHYFLKATAYNYQQAADLAQQTLTEALLKFPKHPKLTGLLAVITLRYGNENKTAALSIINDAQKYGVALTTYLDLMAEYATSNNNFKEVASFLKTYHKYAIPTGKSLFYQARAYAKLGYFHNALKTLNEATTYMPITPYRTSINFWQMVIHKNMGDDKGFYKHLQWQLSVFDKRYPQHWEAQNICVEFLYEKHAFQECYKYIVPIYKAGKLPPDLLPILQYLVWCEYDVDNEINVPPVTAESIIETPVTLGHYRANAIYYWMLGKDYESAQAFEKAAGFGSNVGFYLARAYWRSTYDETKRNYSIELYKKMKKIVPESIDYQMQYWEQNLYFRAARHKEAKTSFNELIAKFPKMALRKNTSATHYASRQKINTENLSETNEFERYSKMLLSL
ncbi:hypothetical protein GGR32_001896 [Mesonia hippocampi]|uniref:Tetratricopeptide repeat protein n=1 Tax=Mesonia hippocampi TaxID=1628250 RepID=A0A840EZZ4_9FLAO|nr:hypothetical protein [Mesonia hippocampi]MBB4119594.1 hypothetical protein [Mesonia hippocampi]